MPGSPDRDRILDKAAMERAFQALSERLGEMEVRGQVYIVGGQAMVLAHRRSKSTLDVDALMIDPRESVLEAASAIGREQGLDSDWLNDDVRKIAILPHRRDERAQVIFESPHLVVTGTSARRMLAMKVRACRAQDERDIELLLRQLHVKTMREVREIHSAVYPYDGIPWRKQERVEALLGRVLEEHDRERRR